MEPVVKPAIELLTLIPWFKSILVKYTKKTRRQIEFGWLGVLIGTLSSVVNFSLGYKFGEHLAQNFNFSPHAQMVMGTYFAVTAMLPLLFLAGYTSYQVLQELVKPAPPFINAIIPVRKKITSALIHVFVTAAAALSAIPFTYITHVNLADKMGYSIYVIDIAAFFAPLFVNSWALNNIIAQVLNYYRYLRMKFMYKDPAYLDITLRHQLQNKLLLVLRTIEYEQAYKINYYHRLIFNRIDQTRYRRAVVPADVTNNIYLTAVKHLFYLASNPLKIQASSLSRTLFCLAGQIMCAASAYQYFGNGVQAARAMNLSENVACMVGVGALICNSALAAYAGYIVFTNLYNWIVRQFMIQFSREDDKDVDKISAIIDATPKKISWLNSAGSILLNLAIVIVAASAATPNLYLTLQQQDNFNFLGHYFLLFCSFVGPYVINYFSISRVITRRTKRQRLTTVVENLLAVISRLRVKYVLAVNAYITPRE